ncbi:NAD(P)H dehydrogenase [Alsobacter metallidurans]|uniref:NAD(P)H dehydrogenase n=1 Tax=Alsobacter metallidurans TaxID=340221 RepID=A0A917MGV3_9HYPH|nr:NAD(P)H-dependent oxidoreductase [Alsobacter metallidurans]GGH12750.1 NAD(P)H dehydrogenase [Alsobacter metallidurans]
MHALIVYAHPEPTSFNAAMRDAAVAAIAAAGHTAEVSDLYGEGFNPVAGRHDFTTVADPDRFHYQTEQEHAALHDGFAPDLRREQERVARADVLILQFPLWWGGPPAILKGWCERVLAYGVAYVDGARFDTGLFKGRRALFSVTTGGTPERFSSTGVYGPIEQVLYPVQRLLLEYLGFDVLPPFVAYGAPRVGEEERAGYLGDWAERVRAAMAAPVDRSDAAAASALTTLGSGAWGRKR